ncbi:hypothetical protein ACQKGC_26945, partial [Allorhizobium pseudoryzae]
TKRRQPRNNATGSINPTTSTQIGRGAFETVTTIRLWINRFGRYFVTCIRRDRSKSNDKWHMG